MLSLWFCQYRWCTDCSHLLTAASQSVRELCLCLPLRWKEFIGCPASLSLLRFGWSKCLPYWISAGVLLQWVCFCCCRQIFLWLADVGQDCSTLGCYSGVWSCGKPADVGMRLAEIWVGKLPCCGHLLGTMCHVLPSFLLLSCSLEYGYFLTFDPFLSD